MTMTENESTETVDREEDGLKNPMRFSIRDRTIDLDERLRHPDFENKHATEIEIGGDQMYISWEWVDDAE